MPYAVRLRNHAEASVTGTHLITLPYDTLKTTAESRRLVYLSERFATLVLFPQRLGGRRWHGISPRPQCGRVADHGLNDLPTSSCIGCACISDETILSCAIAWRHANTFVVSPMGTTTTRSPPPRRSMTSLFGSPERRRALKIRVGGGGEKDRPLSTWKSRAGKTQIKPSAHLLTDAGKVLDSRRYSIPQVIQDIFTWPAPSGDFLSRLTLAADVRHSSIGFFFSYAVNLDICCLASNSNWARGHEIVKMEVLFFACVWKSYQLQFFVHFGDCVMMSCRHETPSWNWKRHETISWTFIRYHVGYTVNVIWNIIASTAFQFLFASDLMHVLYSEILYGQKKRI